TAPKFPSISNLDFLMRYAALDPERHARAREMALRQLDAMRAGGIHDHLGGGFHRYSTDREWLVPHFEQMRYDQAEIGWAHFEARARRVRPHRDDKVLASWNGLMISALARGARVLDDPALAGAAARAAEFVWSKMYEEKTGGLARRWREGETASPGQLDDYA